MYVQFAPPEDLKHLVCFFYVMEYSNSDEPLQALLPSGTEIMGWQYAGKWYVRLPKPNYAGIDEFILPDFYTVGQQVTSYRLTAMDAKTAIMGVTLQPGSLWQCFRRPVAAFTQCVADTRELFAYQSLQPALERFCSAENTEERLEVLIGFYRQLNQEIHWERSLVDDALEQIYKHKGCISVAEICRSLHVNERYLQRHFKLRIGVTAQQYIGLMRFSNIFLAIHLQRGDHPMQVIALLHSYYDLSHFYKEYKRYFGIAPSAFELDKFTWLKELVSETPYNLTVQNQYINDAG
ncbi:MAG: AraC family transcriptional regulator [Parapedobacter sp.]|nr:MAG: AraC family transcriptional regulator [Parapedobacter sp.]